MPTRPLFGAGLEAMVRESGRFELIRDELPTKFTRSSPLRSNPEVDVVLAEVGDADAAAFAGANGVGAIVPVVLLTGDLSRRELLRLLRRGTLAVLPRDASHAEIFAAIETAAVGLTTMGRDELDLLLPTATLSDGEDEATLLEALSPREIEVLALMAQGLANKNIANRLGISEHTAKFHVSSILSKLGASSRTEAVTRGLKDGLLVV